MRLILILFVTSALVGCGGGGGGSTPTTAPVPSPTINISVVPSLGKFSAGTAVSISKLDGTSLASGTIGNDGKATIAYPSSYTGAMIVTVVGATGVTYFDEGSGTDQLFGAGSQLLAITAAPQAQIGVTALTNAAAANLSAVGGLSGATSAAINDANAKVASVFGLADILIAPTPVSLANVGSLDLAVPSDRYALVLAALAKSAASGSSAATQSANLALDLKDSKLNGLNGAAAIAGFSLTPATLAASYQAAASIWATRESKAVATILPLVVTPDVSKVAAVANQSDVNLAKSMFAELRTTLYSFSNSNKTGLIDNQAARINDDLRASASPEVNRIGDNINSLITATSAFEDAKAYTATSTSNFQLTTGGVLIRSTGSLQSLWDYGSSWNQCSTDYAKGVTSTVTCYFSGPDSVDRVNQTLEITKLELTQTTANQYAYSTSISQSKVTLNQYGRLSNIGAGIATAAPAGAGSVVKTLSGNTATALSINGTFPPPHQAAAGGTTPGAQAVVISIARTPLVAANNFRYSITGSVSTANLTNATNNVKLSLDDGTYVDFDEFASRPVAAKIVGTVQTLRSKLTGTLELGAPAKDVDGKGYGPTAITFSGTVTDAELSMTGKFDLAATNYSLYHSTSPESPSNYLQASLTFTGTIQATNRPLLKLVLAATKNGLTTTAVTLSYSYGTVSITGSGVVDSGANGVSSMNLSNQDGILVAITNGTASNATKVTKGGATLATITNGTIFYIDGYSESLTYTICKSNC